MDFIYLLTREDFKLDHGTCATHD